MWIYRDISCSLKKNSGSLAQIIVGPRQSGKSSLLYKLGEGKVSEASLDDLQSRTIAQKDPNLFLQQFELPVIIDEAQYAPNLFPAIKMIIDKKKRGGTPLSTVFQLTGSNQFLMDRLVKETLVGRAKYYFLNTLTASEILNSLPSTPISHIIFNGGWPEIYTNQNLSPISFLQDYIRNYVEKDIVISAGITKQREFNNFLSLLATRTGQFLNYSDLAKTSGVRSSTIKEWVSILERSQIIQLLPPFLTNATKRITKQHKIYFLDTGIATRLQGWSEPFPLIKSPQGGPLFETLVFAEIAKFITNFDKPWKVFVWRTKEKDEIDFVLQLDNNKFVAFDAKMAIDSIKPQSLPNSFKKQFPNINQLILISYGGETKKLSNECLQVPIAQLTSFLKNL